MIPQKYCPNIICTVLVSKSPRHRPHPGPVGRCAGQPGAGGLRQEAQRQLTSEHKNAVISYRNSCFLPQHKKIAVYKDKEDIYLSILLFLSIFNGSS